MSELQSAWFARLEAMHRATDGESGLECAMCCTARCCPHAAMARRPAAYTVSHVAIMLPFELEYIAAQTGVDPARFRREPVTVAPGVTAAIGVFDVDTPCPFLTADHRCAAYAVRPLDCRSFPLVPLLAQVGVDGAPLEFHLAANCPSQATFRPGYQARVKGVWQEFVPHLSAEYRALYARL